MNCRYSSNKFTMSQGLLHTCCLTFNSSEKLSRTWSLKWVMTRIGRFCNDIFSEHSCNLDFAVGQQSTPVFFPFLRVDDVPQFPHGLRRSSAEPDNYGECRDGLNDRCAELFLYCLGETEFLQLFWGKKQPLPSHFCDTGDDLTWDCWKMTAPTETSSHRGVWLDNSKRVVI